MSERLRYLVLAGALIGSGSAVVVLYDNANNQNQSDLPQGTLILENPAASPTPTNGIIIEVPKSTHIPDLSDAQLERRLERKLDITLLDRSEYLESIGRKRVKPSRFDWSEERLRDLEQALGELPARFHNQNPEGKDLTIVLQPDKDIDGFCLCLPNFPESDGSIHISRGDFNTSPRVFTQILAHELAHDLQPWKTDNPSSKRFKDYTSPWVEKRDNILGQIRIAGNKMLDRIYILHPDVWKVDDSNFWEKDQLTDDEKRLFFASRLLYGITYYDTEFFAVMAETYVQGPRHFTSMYEDYISKDEVEKFYAFMKKIFRGDEYDEDGKLVKASSDDNS